MEELKPATAAAILAVDDIRRERVDCPEWGLYLYIRTMSITKRTAWEQHLIAQREKADAGKVPPEDRYGDAVADLISRCACDKDGNLLFSHDQVAALGERASGPMQRCYDVAARLNYLTDDHMDELVKNSEGDQSDGSGSA
jgi:hypothetical protein